MPTRLPADRPICLPVYQYVIKFLHTSLPAYLPICLTTLLCAISLPAYLPTYLPTCLPACLLAYLIACISAYSRKRKRETTERGRWWICPSIYAYILIYIYIYKCIYMHMFISSKHPFCIRLWCGDRHLWRWQIRAERAPVLPYTFDHTLLEEM
jgi:hypothetical protein